MGRFLPGMPMRVSPLAPNHLSRQLAEENMSRNKCKAQLSVVTAPLMTAVLTGGPMPWCYLDGKRVSK